MEFPKLDAAVTRKSLLCTLGVVVLVLLAFHLGRATGLRKAGYACRWGDNYSRNFEGRGGMMPLRGLSDRDSAGAHGIFGRVVSLSADSFVMDDGGTEHVITVDATTQFRRFHDAIALADIKADDRVVVIGEPDDKGRVAAKLVRVMPAPDLQR